MHHENPIDPCPLDHGPPALSNLGAANFGDDSTFLKQHTELIVLSANKGQSKVAVAPGWQGRVMTSSAQGNDGHSFGWINRELIASGKLQPHMNAFGGEDRFWLGPEGGQCSIFFAPGGQVRPRTLVHAGRPGYGAV